MQLLAPVTGRIQRPSTTWSGRGHRDTEYSVIERGSGFWAASCELFAKYDPPL